MFNEIIFFYKHNKLLKLNIHHYTRYKSYIKKITIKK